MGFFSLFLPSFLVLSAAVRVDVYTMGPGEELFERYGHAAICVIGDTGPALCYNYGTTDFSMPPERLSWLFLRGKAPFWVSVERLSRMVRHYRREDRSIWVQHLPLTREEVDKIAAALAHDALPENREYLYHHLFDNCTTRIRDIIDGALDGRLSADSAEPIEVSFRHLGEKAILDHPELILLGDLFIGRRVDRAPTIYESMFLPDYLRREIALRLEAPAEPVYVRRAPPPGRPAPVGGLGAWLILAGGVTVGLELLKRIGPRSRRFAQGLAVAGLVVLSLCVWGLMAISAVPELKLNEIALLFLPSDFILFGKGAFRSRYGMWRIIGVVIVLVLRVLHVFIQPLFGPAVLALGLLAVAGMARERRRERASL